MTKTISKIISLILIITLVLPIISIWAIPAAADYKNNMAESSSEVVEENTEEISQERTNITYLDGQPGDTYLVYTWEEGGKKYKAVDNSNNDFSNVYSTIYVLDSKGNYVVDSIQEVGIGTDGMMTITIDNADETKEVRKSENLANLTNVSFGVDPLINKYDWITDYEDGSTYIKNLTISALIAEIGYVATALSGPVGGAIATGVTAVANTLFAINAKWAYYHKIYNWKHSERNYHVIEKTEWTEFYSDSAHQKYLGHTYYEWLDN